MTEKRMYLDDRDEMSSCEPLLDEDYQHMTSITTKDYTKGIFKQKQAHMIKNGYLILYPHKGVNIENILYFWCEVLWPAVKFDLMGSVSKDYTKGIFKETGI